MTGFEVLRKQADAAASAAAIGLLSGLSLFSTPSTVIVQGSARASGQNPELLLLSVSAW
ncbi:hypothetical protein PV772_18235 [Pseudarthrobacter sp. CC12]